MVICAGRHFVDVRILKSAQYIGAADMAAFEWVITGTERWLSPTRCLFEHELNTQELERLARTGRPLAECRNAPDVGDFSPLGTDRLEVGHMMHCGAVTPYREVWRSLDPERHLPDAEVLAPKGAAPARAWQAKLGKYIEAGRWAQGALWHENRLHVIRRYNDGGWRTLIEFGDAALFDMSRGSIWEPILHSDEQ